ncbi:MAG: linear amide C-N hydrolase [Cyanobium sp.]
MGAPQGRATAAGAVSRERPLQLSLSDASGDSAVVEVVNGVNVVHRGKDTVVMTNEPALDWQLKNLGRYLMTLPTAKTSKDALEGVHSMIKTVYVPRGANNNAVGIETEDVWPTVWPTVWTTLADSVNWLYSFQSANSPNLFWLDFSMLDVSEGAPVKSVPGNGISMNGVVPARLTGMK